MKKHILVFVLAALIFASSPSFSVAAKKSSVPELQLAMDKLQEQIKSLQSEIIELQTQIELAMAAEIKFTKTLRRGMMGNEVKNLQQFLIDYGVYKSRITGIFDGRTVTSVKKLQKQLKIRQTGILDEKTRELFNELIAKENEEGAPEEELSETLWTIPATSTIFNAPTSTYPASVISTSSATIIPTPTTQSLSVISSPTTISSSAPQTYSAPSTNTANATVSNSTATTTLTATATSTTSTQTTTPAPAPTTAPITVTSPNGGETWQYNLNYRLGYVLNGVSSNRIGVKLLKGSEVVYNTITSTTWGDGIFHISLNGVNLYSSVGSGANYKIRIYNQDDQGVYDDSDNYFTILPTDITPPVISSVSASSITSNSAIITWTTDEPAISFVNYGSTPTNWKVIPENMNLNTSHSFTLTNLTSNTVYSYRVYSRDNFGNSIQGLPPSYNFTTLEAPSSNIRLENLMALSSTLESLKILTDKLLNLLR